MTVHAEVAHQGVSADERKQAAEALAKRVKDNVGIGINVQIAEVGGVARSQGKAVRIVDKR